LVACLKATIWFETKNRKIKISIKNFYYYFFLLSFFLRIWPSSNMPFLRKSSPKGNIRLHSKTTQKVKSVIRPIFLNVFYYLSIVLLKKRYVVLFSYHFLARLSSNVHFVVFSHVCIFVFVSCLFGITMFGYWNQSLLFHPFFSIIYLLIWIHLRLYLTTFK
jgi:hypothetical protein